MQPETGYFLAATKNGRKLQPVLVILKDILPVNIP
jgi:hypothetical protein